MKKKAPVKAASEAPGALSNPLKRKGGGKSSKQKGKNAEKEVCEWLDAWWGVPAKTFVPSRGSGGWKKARESAESWEPGDTTSRTPELTIGFPFCIDSKKHESWDFYEWFSTKKVPTILPWWQKLAAEAAVHKLCPLLILMQNYKPGLFVTPFEAWTRAGLDPFQLPWAAVITYPEEDKIQRLVIVPQDVFMGKISPEQAKGFGVD